MTEMHDFLDYDNDHDNEHRFAEHEYAKKRLETQRNGGLDSPSAVSSGPNGRQIHAGMTGWFPAVLVRGHFVFPDT